MIHRRVTALGLMCCLFLMVATSACGPSKKTLEAIAGGGVKIEGLVKANSSLPDQLFAKGLINEQKHTFLVAAFAKAETDVAAFNTKMAVVLTQEKPSLADLLPIVSELISDVEAINPDDKVWNNVLDGVEIALEGIATYFALAKADLNREGFSDRQICRQARIRYDRNMIDRIVDYANGVRHTVTESA